MTIESEKKDEKKYRILSLDGGGIRGVLSARILKKVEEILETKGHKLHTYFDLVAGTSTGSILAAGIACKKSAGDMIGLYRDEGKKIFPNSVRSARKRRWLSQLFGDKVQKFLTKPFGIKVLYPNQDGEPGLAQVLQEKLGPAKLSDIKELCILIPAYDVKYRNTTWFCNFDDEPQWYDNIELWKICTASAAAPTFFPPYKLFSDKDGYLPHIDGGVSANNPSLIAIARAFELDKTSNWSNIAVLSIGTAQTTKSYEYEEVEKWGLASWAKNIPNIFMDPAAISSETICRRMMTMQVGSDRNYLRLSFDLKKFCNEEYTNISKQEKKKKKDMIEEIDNPNNFKELIKAAEWYLEKGDVIKYENKKYARMQGVIEGIEDFINSNPKPKPIIDSNSKPN
ncbi:patatin-like phospholipase family protein [Okeania sp. KiyG1]|uniref:patatin-like phospholipase family protein n=1 Tax=Okeania sp. KiyG1 TaxID=2720165 RepID=UPI001923255B|nr:patatin-like phospholipase family protein [Okeania sp. KiyG1]GGA55370.1 patatin [Okeania sp. KiyG1]